MRRQVQRQTSDQPSFADKWTPAIASKGFCGVPNCLLFCQANIGLTGEELAVLLGILVYRFGLEHPFPAVETIARNTGKAHQTIRTNIRSMDNKGLLKRVQRSGKSSEYDVAPLMHKLEHHVCINPIQKQTGVYSNFDRPPYSFSSTKEDYPKRRINNTNDGFSSIGDNLGRIDLQRRG